MKLYKISQHVNNGYDTFDSAIVVAPSPKAAKQYHPNGDSIFARTTDLSDWAKPEDVTVEFIGTPRYGAKAGVILASFNSSG